MNDLRTSKTGVAAYGAAILAATLGGLNVLAAPETVVLPSKEMAPQAMRPRVEQQRPQLERAVPDIAQKSAGKGHTVEAGIVVRLADVELGVDLSRDRQPKPHRQGDALDGLSKLPHQPAKIPAGEPPHPPMLESATRTHGSVQQLFDAIDVDEAFHRPPDTHLAVGPQYAVEVVNSGFAVFSKLGGVTRSYRSFDNFLANNLPDDWNGRFFDPRIVYDPTYEKFVMLVLGKDEVEKVSGFWIAVSEDSDPRGNWCVRARDATDSDAGAATWIDFAGLGTDAYGVYVTGNYLFFSDDSLRGAAIHSFPAQMMTSCGPVGTWADYDVRWPTSDVPATSTQPAQAHTQNADGETFFVTTHSLFGDQALLTRLSGNRANANLSSAEILIPAYGAMLNNIAQPGTTEDLDGGKSWPLSAVYVDGRVLFSLTTAVAQTPESSGWLTVELDTDTNTRVWDDLQWPGQGRFLMYPALVYQGDTRDGNVAIFGTFTDDESLLTPLTDYPSGYVRVYDNRANDTGGFVATFVDGTSPYVWFDDDMRNRWGDYSGGAYDWSCGHAWGAVQSANGPASWKTTIAAYEFDNEGGCPQLFVTAPVLNQELPSTGSYLITWDADNLPPDDDIYVFYDTDDDLPVQIAGPLPVTQHSVNWAIPELPRDDVRIIVGSLDDNTNQYSALHYSDPFTILDATPPQPNPPVWQNPPTATSSEAIAMSMAEVSDGSGGPVRYRFEFAGNPTGGLGGADSDWGPVPAYQNAGLQPNHEYCYLAQARDQAFNQTFYTALTCTYTLANPPTVGSFTNVSNTAITVQANTNGNSDDTDYQFENTATGTVSPWLQLPLWENDGLLPDRTYAYRVKARNSDGIETAWALLGAAATTNDDADGDGVLAADDNCLNVANPDQRDTDGDNIGNLCDFDLSQDCVVNFIDLGVLRLRFFSSDPDADFNDDGAVNFVDLGLMRTGFFAAPGPSGRPNVCLDPG